VKSRKINALNVLDPILSSASQTRPILLSPESMGRAHVRRPMRLSGVVEREAFVGGPSVDAFATVLGRFLETQDEAQAARDRRTRQAWAEIAQAVRKVR
jgi:hypothetical protein